MLSVAHMLYVRLSKLRNERGASVVEYGLLIAALATVVVLVVTDLGEAIQDAFQALVDEFPLGGGGGE